MVKKVSKSHVDNFLKQEQLAIEKLAEKMSRKVVNKFDRLLLRDLLHFEKKKPKTDDFIEKRPSSDKHRFHVMINMHSGKRKRLPTEFPPTRRRKRKLFAEKIKKTGRLACQRLEESLREIGIENIQSFWLTHSVVGDLTQKELEKIAFREDVQSIIAIKPQPVLTLDISRPLIKADIVESNLDFDGTCIDVAVLDTGIDIQHTALTGVVISQQDFTGEGVGDGRGHGTHVAGIIASQDTQYRGIAPGARIMDIKIIDSNGNSQPDWAIAGIQAAVEAGVDVASNSWGWSHGSNFWEDQNCSCVLCTAADNAVAAGVVFVVAAGNEDNDTCRTYDTHIRCPGNACEVITVGASNDNDNMADFSSLGPTPDGRTKPEIVAPGANIVSCRASGTNTGSPVDDNWTEADGTSMACPHVAGVVALMLDKNKQLTSSQVKAILMETAVDIGATPNEMGAGRVDALAAVNAS
ncbi:MAG: S8 family serine peptidase [Candidatus Hodarchaeota archaeon]